MSAPFEVGMLRYQLRKVPSNYTALLNRDGNLAIFTPDGIYAALLELQTPTMRLTWTQGQEPNAL